MSSKTVVQDRAALLEQVQSILAGQVSEARADMARYFVQAFLRRVPDAELIEETPERVAAISAGLMRFAGQRKRRRRGHRRQSGRRFRSVTGHPRRRPRRREPLPPRDPPAAAGAPRLAFLPKRNDQNRVVLDLYRAL